jgi:arylsulfatase
MEQDRTEMHDLAARHPEAVSRMAAQYEKWAKERGIVPFGSWKKNGKGQGKKKGARKTSFQLKSGEHLSTDKSPAIANRAFEVSAQVSGLPAKGVIIAQGGINFGWSLYVDDEKLTIAIRQGGKLVSASATLPAGPSQALKASILNDRLVLAAGKKELTSLRCSPFISDHPVDGLEVGRDAGGLVGDYGVRNEFTAEVTSLKVVLR